MTDNPQHCLYRVVAIRRSNGLLVPMGFGLTGDEAERIQAAVDATKVFERVRVEPDRQSGSMHPGTE